MSVLCLGAFTACEDDTEYDIDWPVPTITGVSSYNDLLSATITLQGNFTQVNKVYFGEVEGKNLQVADDQSSLTIEVPRTMAVDGAPIRVTNEYRQSFETAELFVPIIPVTTVIEVSAIQTGLTFTINGENVDLLTEITVDGEPTAVISSGINTLVVSVAGIDLKAGSLVDVAFKSLAKNEIPTATKVNVIYPFITYEEIVIWGFEDGTHIYSGEGTATVETGDVLGTTEKYFSLRGPGYGWDKATGEMIATEIPDLSSLVNPYLTFCIRTPEGSAGYFQMEDQAGNWRHFGYGFNTGGEWVIISQPLEESWEGGDFNIGAFMPKLGFKAGNAGSSQDLDIAYVKITEGKYDGSQEIGDAIGGSTKPAVISIMDFEERNEWPDIMNGDNLIASLDFRKDEINAFVGNEFFTYVDDGSQGAWGAYWGQTISKDVKDVDLSAFEDPYLSFALNSETSQYVIVRMYQYDEDLVMVQKFFPNTYGKWATFQFSLFNTDMENWSDGSTELGAHYASLKRFNPDIPFDRIEIIVGKNGENPIGVSIDEMVITEGARYNE
jgi:hypothetical protein